MLFTTEEVLNLRRVYILQADHQRRSVQVAECVYRVWFTKEEGLKLWSLYKMCCLPKKSFKVAESIYYVLITKDEVIKLRSLYIVWFTKEEVLKLGLYISCIDHQRRSFKIAECISDVLFSKEVLKLRSVFIICGLRKF